ncbi:MAG TPA: cytochrome c family protein [Caulobacteraceae bacterium]
MSDLTFNKIAGAVLATGLAVFLLREVSAVVFEQEPPEKPGYAIAVAEGGGEGGPAAEAPIDWGTVLPVADIEAGKAVAAKCASCHSFDPSGANGTGPGLYGVVGRKPGTHPGFNYSTAMVEHGAKVGKWDYEDLGEFLKAPQKHIPGTKMTFVGLKKPEDRIAIIAYLHSLGSSLPFPAPNPAVAAPAEDAAAAGAEGAESQAPASGAAQAPTETQPQTPAKASEPTG